HGPQARPLACEPAAGGLRVGCAFRCGGRARIEGRGCRVLAIYTRRGMPALKALFWASLGALVWTHAGYPAAAAVAARVRGRAVRRGEGTPRVSVIVAAHDEEAVIGR